MRFRYRLATLQLRTKQQTGYIVHSGSTQVQVSRSFLFLASQSSQVPPAQLLRLYEAFLDRYRARGTHGPWSPGPV